MAGGGGPILSVIIPSTRDPYLQHTIEDLQAHANGALEIVPVLDEGPTRIGMRGAINKGVALSHGRYIMKCDAHCSFGDAFDWWLCYALDNSPHRVVTPRRYRLDVETWEKFGDPIDIMRIQRMPDKLHGVPWTSRSVENADIPLDETEVFQGSCWAMSREHWDWLGGLDPAGYGTFTQEPLEICLKTWLGHKDGQVCVEKRTWYAHKDRKYKRTWHSLAGDDAVRGNFYSLDYWMNNRWEKRVRDISWLAEHFGRRI